MSCTYSIEAIEYGEHPELGSVCAVQSQSVYEDPNHSGMPMTEAVAAAAEIAQSGITDEEIEQEWTFLS